MFVKERERERERGRQPGRGTNRKNDRKWHSDRLLYNHLGWIKRKTDRNVRRLCEKRM